MRAMINDLHQSIEINVIYVRFRVLELDDAYVEAHFNFGNLSYKGGKLMRHMPLGAKLSNWMGNMPELGRGWAMFTIIGRIGRRL